LENYIKAWIHRITMDRSPILLLLVIVIGLSVSLLAYSATKGTVSMTERMFSESDSMNPMKRSVVSGYFSINKLRYYDRGLALAEEQNLTKPVDRCTINLTAETLIIELLISDERYPENCIMRVDKKVSHISIDPIKITSRINMSRTIQFYTIVVRDIKINETHKVSVCCEDICHEDTIKPIC
jgi:hypothetical protein